MWKSRLERRIYNSLSIKGKCVVTFIMMLLVIFILALNVYQLIGAKTADDVTGKVTTTSNFKPYYKLKVSDCVDTGHIVYYRRRFSSRQIRIYAEKDKHFYLVPLQDKDQEGKFMIVSALEGENKQIGNGVVDSIKSILHSNGISQAATHSMTGKLMYISSDLKSQVMESCQSLSGEDLSGLEVVDYYFEEAYTGGYSRSVLVYGVILAAFTVYFLFLLKKLRSKELDSKERALINEAKAMAMAQRASELQDREPQQSGTALDNVPQVSGGSFDGRPQGGGLFDADFEKWLKEQENK